MLDEMAQQMRTAKRNENGGAPMSTCPTMTIHELAEAFRANLIPTSESTEARYIIEGKYPFAEGLPPSQTGGKNTFKIWREPFYRWLQSRIPGEVIRVPEQR